ncbi:B-cell receptor CD22-like [Palaemon carinicauda]|uniref:B-cell receptor CD22-like n=1 Tax=Palaemon carinicauda TaxID=392227 RepID=UPI0035B58300
MFCQLISLQCRWKASQRPVGYQFRYCLLLQDVPKATISIDAGSSSSLDSGLPSSGLREGSSATLTCVTRANPPVYNLTFMFNGRPLHRQNVITKGRSLALLELQHQDSGLYTCLASNTEGDGESNAVALHIDYAPVCAWRGEREILAAVNEKVKMNCYMKVSPSHVTFDWTSSHKFSVTCNLVLCRYFETDSCWFLVALPKNVFVNTGKESALRHQDKGLSSEGWVMVATVSGNGMNQWVKCSATNDVGGSSHPCVFFISLVALSLH